MNDETKKSLEAREKVAKYEKLKKDFAELEREEKKLRDYLNINVFDYAKNMNDMENIFSIRKTSVTFFDQTKGCPEINPNIPILEINNLTKCYSSSKVPSLVNVTLKLFFGDIHVVIGADGSGKTTLFNCLLGVEDYEGDILIDGSDKKIHPESDAHRIISFVPATFSWDLYATVEDVIFERFSELELTEIEAHNYIRSALETLQISHLRHFHMIELNLLEKKKIQIVLALINDPNIIVFDELFLGLQHHECLDLLSVLSQMKQNDRAMLIFSHEINYLCKFAGIVSVLSDGKIFYTGTVENLLLTQQNSYSIVTSDNQRTIKLLEELNCSYSYNSILDVIYAKFEGKLGLLGFQSDCAREKIILYEIKALEINVQDLFPILKKEGNKEAIKAINAMNYFVP